MSVMPISNIPNARTDNDVAIVYSVATAVGFLRLNLISDSHHSVHTRIIAARIPRVALNQMSHERASYGSVGAPRSL